MIKDDLSLIPIENSFIEQISHISHICRLNTWTVEDYKNELGRNDSFNTACIVNSSNPIIVIGFIVARLIIPNNPPYNHTENTKKMLFKEKEKEAEILNIAVSPQYQKKGVGQIIFDCFTSFCIENRIEIIWLEVRQSNSQALSFYYKNGFQIIYQRKNYYQNPVENALVLKLNLVFEKF